jgi:hypothetical protein
LLSRQTSWAQVVAIAIVGRLAEGCGQEITLSSGLDDLGDLDD